MILRKQLTLFSLPKSPENEGAMRQCSAAQAAAGFQTGWHSSGRLLQEFSQGQGQGQGVDSASSLLFSPHEGIITAAGSGASPTQGLLARLHSVENGEATVSTSHRLYHWPSEDSAAARPPSPASSCCFSGRLPLPPPLPPAPHWEEKQHKGNTGLQWT